MAERRTHKEIAALKANWRSDPCWDIADTEGFEAHRDELEAFQRRCEAEWALVEQHRTNNRAEALACSPELARYIESLERRLESMSDDIGALKDRCNALEYDLKGAKDDAARANRRVDSLNCEMDYRTE